MYFHFETEFFPEQLTTCLELNIKFLKAIKPFLLVETGKVIDIQSHTDKELIKLSLFYNGLMDMNPNKPGRQPCYLQLQK